MSMDSSVGPWQDPPSTPMSSDHPVMQDMQKAEQAKTSAVGRAVMSGWTDTWAGARQNQFDQRQHEQGPNDTLRDEEGGKPGDPEQVIRDFNSSGHFVPHDSEGNMGWSSRSELGGPTGTGVLDEGRGRPATEDEIRAANPKMSPGAIKVAFADRGGKDVVPGENDLAPYEAQSRGIARGKIDAEINQNYRARRFGDDNAVVPDSESISDKHAMKNIDFESSEAFRGPRAAFKGAGRGKISQEVIQASRDTEAKYGIPASVTTAQWALESGYGRRMPKGSNNPFGIKAKEGEDYVEAHTHERGPGGKLVPAVARFKKFGSLSEAFEAHAELLSKKGAYKKAMDKSWDTTLFVKAVAKRYATDPKYAKKLLDVIRSQGLRSA